VRMEDHVRGRGYSRKREQEHATMVISEQQRNLFLLG
jgi:hypothetical protein